MNHIEKIKNLIDAGVKVYDKTESYECSKTQFGDYVVTYKPNGWTIGAFWKDNKGTNLVAPFYYKDGKRVYL